MGNVCSFCEKEESEIQLVKLNKEEQEIYKELENKMKINRNAYSVCKRKEI
tara:strand:- start:112 stop:264 length:153 start_codon:yes stop_codon:yes gene_type:complete